MRTNLMISALLLAAPTVASAQAPTRDLTGQITHSVTWLLVGGLLFVLTFKVVDWTTPGDLKQQLAEGNTALAVYVGSLAIAAAILIASVVGG
jgi:uncharacterized membrane protein YjfL (UPF0719 family)